LRAPKIEPRTSGYSSPRYSYKTTPRWPKIVPHLCTLVVYGLKQREKKPQTINPKSWSKTNSKKPLEIFKFSKASFNERRMMKNQHFVEERGRMIVRRRECEEMVNVRRVFIGKKCWKNRLNVEKIGW